MNHSFRLIATALLATVAASPLFADDPPQASIDARVISVSKIWDRAEHNAFTDLIHWHDQWFCVFRESSAHVGGEGKTRVLGSQDGTDWRSLAVLEESGIDLRDPKLSVTPSDQLMITMGGSIYDGTTLLGKQPRVSFSTDGVTWSAPQPVLEPGEWLWRVTWHDGRAYGASYSTLKPRPASESESASESADSPTAARQPAETREEWDVTLFASDNGIDFEGVTRWEIPGRPNETTLRFLPSGEMLALVRREAGNRQAWFGRALAPYTEWTWQETPHHVGGPNFILLPDGRLVGAGRHHAEGPKTSIAWMTLEGDYSPFLSLPSGGDCSYPGLVWHDEHLWVSYYSSHEGKSSIYLAKIELPAE